MFVFVFLSFLFNAFAENPKDAELRFNVGDSASARSLPRINPKVAEIIIRDCDRNLSAILKSFHRKQGEDAEQSGQKCQVPARANVFT